MLAILTIALAVAAAVPIPHIETEGGTHGDIHLQPVSAHGAAPLLDKQPLLADTTALDEEGKPVRGLKIKTKKKKVRQHHGSQVCMERIKVSSRSEKYELCPEECPYSVQDKTDNSFCSFRCVHKNECAKFNPNSPVTDDELMVCRPPVVDGCAKGKLDGTDTCETCQRSFSLGADGKCHFDYQFMVYGVAAVFGSMFVVFWVWYIDLTCRPITSERGLAHGLHFRTRAKLHMPVEDGRRELWPINTNLCTEQVAGPGMVLHMNFQVAIIIWLVLVGLGWIVLASVIDHDLFILGTRGFQTPRDRCILIAWGYETQQRLMWTKILFLVCTYIGTFVLCMVLGVRHLRLYQKMDDDTKTMKDFAAMCMGLPIMTGDKRVEEMLKTAASKKFGKDAVIGVSVAWDYTGDTENTEFTAEGGETEAFEDILLEKLYSDVDERAHEAHTSGLGRANEAEGETEYTGLSKLLHGLESSALAYPEKDKDLDKKTEYVINNMSTSQHAFVVFNTEAARDKAVEIGEFEFEGVTVKLEKTEHEPDACVWNAFDSSTPITKVLRLFKGFGVIFLGLFIWVTLFYGPYAFSLWVFNYDGGKEPGFAYGIAFTLVVCIGNATMYFVCGMVSENVGFRWIAQREQCYTILYTIACTFNIMVDMVTTYYMAEQIAIGLGFRFYDGRKIEDVPEFTHRFESYAMQRSLAENTYGYLFPSTCLIPFMIEPIATILMPLRVGQLVIRTHRDLMGRASEDLLLNLPMDLGRYADLLLDMVLAILIFYFPGGYTHTLFLSTAGAHVYIYFMDHFKILRAIPAINYTSMNIDWCAQGMLAPCTGLIMSCLVFKMNGQGYGFDMHGIQLVLACSAAFALHCIVHMIVLANVVPLFASAERDDDAEAAVSWSEIATKIPGSWFTTNPVNCLRSKMIYKDNPPCDFRVIGKEHMMRLNKKIGCHFQLDKKMTPYEDYDAATFWSNTASSFKEILTSTPWSSKSGTQL